MPEKTYRLASQEEAEEVARELRGASRKAQVVSDFDGSFHVIVNTGEVSDAVFTGIVNRYRMRHAKLARMRGEPGGVFPFGVSRDVSSVALQALVQQAYEKMESEFSVMHDAAEKGKTAFVLGRFHYIREECEKYIQILRAGG